MACRELIYLNSQLQNKGFIPDLYHLYIILLQRSIFVTRLQWSTTTSLIT